MTLQCDELKGGSFQFLLYLIVLEPMKPKYFALVPLSSSHYDPHDATECGLSTSLVDFCRRAVVAAGLWHCASLFVVD